MIKKVKVPFPEFTYCCQECMKEDKEMWIFVPYNYIVAWFCSRVCYREMLKKWVNT